MSDLYSLLRNRDIISILDGDAQFDKYGEVIISMPYLSGPDLCNISSHFGLPAEYSWGGGALSRWMYLDNLLEYCIEHKKMQSLLAYLFSKEQFTDKLRRLSPQQIEDTYSVIVEKILEQINGILYFGGNELVILNRQFVIKPIKSQAKIEAPAIKTIDHDYIKGLSDRATLDIEQENYDSAITKCRTLLEEVFCYVIELKNEEPSSSGEINGLYKQVKDLYNMHADRDADKRINMLLSGLEKIITSIALMRNKDSDSHGVGSKRIKISEYHARLYLNASIMFADFIIAVAQNQ